MNKLYEILFSKMSWNFRNFRKYSHSKISTYTVYDANNVMWKMFMCYENKPFLSEAGNLGLLLNFDFFQPYYHISYSLGALYISVLNLPCKMRYKRAN